MRLERWALLFIAAVLVLVVPAYGNAAVSGWRRLARMYRATASLKPQVRFVTARMRGVQYMWSLCISADAERVHFSMVGVWRIGHAPITVPWADIAISNSGRGTRHGIRFDFKQQPGLYLVISRNAADKLARISGHELEVPVS
jgi:hypothetical protein